MPHLDHDLLDQHDLPDFADMGALVRAHARAAPSRIALIHVEHDNRGERRLDYATLDARMDAVAAALQRDGMRLRDVVAICAATSIDYAVVFLGALRAGVAVAPLPPGATPATLARMLDDADAKLLFTTREVDVGGAGVRRVVLDDGISNSPSSPGGGGGDGGASPSIDSSSSLAGASSQGLASWLEGAGTFAHVTIDPDAPFNIIYSSGTTGEPKGIVQPQSMRWAYARRAHRYGYGADAVALVSTPLYSNTTLVVFFPALAFGGCVVLSTKFDARGWLELAQRHRVTHAMLVPVQYERLLAHADFDRFDLSSFRWKFVTSAPFAPATKRAAITRWPGELAEFYGSTEGGGSCILEARRFPHKLHTVGMPAPGHDIRLIDEDGRELPRDAIDVAGEVVGRSPSMMTGYHKKPDATREVEWFDAQGQRFLRSGDIGRFDADGFLELVDRRKDVIISGGFNVYPSDLEAVLREHPAVAEAAVVGVASTRWGETPVAFVVLRAGGEGDDRDAAATERAAELRSWANERLGKTQRLHEVHVVDELPRSAIGKVLKRELRERCRPID